MTPNRERAALIVVDMQNSFCKTDGAVADIGFDISMCAKAIEPCVEAVQIARSAGLPIIFTRYVYSPDYSDGGVMVEQIMPELAQVKALRAGTPDADIVPELVVESADTIIDKNRPSSFYNTPLDTLLTDLGRDQLIVCGVTTNCCVESTVRDASHRDMEVFVLADATGELDEDRHNFSLQTMGMLFGRVLSLAEYREEIA